MWCVSAFPSRHATVTRTSSWCVRQRKRSQTTVKVRQRRTYNSCGPRYFGRLIFSTLFKQQARPALPARNLAGCGIGSHPLGVTRWAFTSTVSKLQSVDLDGQSPRDQTGEWLNRRSWAWRMHANVTNFRLTGLCRSTLCLDPRYPSAKSQRSNPMLDPTCLFTSSPLTRGLFVGLWSWRLRRLFSTSANTLWNELGEMERSRAELMGPPPAGPSLMRKRIWPARSGLLDARDHSAR